MRTPAAAGDFIELRPEDFTLGELHAILAGRSDRLPKVLALNALRQKDYPLAEKVKDLERIATSPGEEPRVRHAAALELGRLEGKEPVAALRRLSRHYDLSARRGALAGLQQKAPEGTEKASPRSRSAVIEAFQARDPGARLPFPTVDQLRPPGKGAGEARTAPASAPELEAALGGWQERGRTAPGEGTVAVECHGRSLLVLTERGVAELGPDELRRGPLAVGVVLARYTLEGERWSPRYRILAQPAPKGSAIEVFLVTADGKVAYAGLARLKGRDASFTLTAVEMPGVIPGEVRGRYQDGRLSLESIRSEIVSRGRNELRLRR